MDFSPTGNHPSWREVAELSGLFVTAPQSPSRPYPTPSMLPLLSCLKLPKPYLPPLTPSLPPTGTGLDRVSVPIVSLREPNAELDTWEPKQEGLHAMERPGSPALPPSPHSSSSLGSNAGE